LIKFSTPVISDQDTTVPGLFLADIKMVLNTITITGYLISDDTSSALEKKQALVSFETLGSSHPEAPSSIGAVWKSGGFTLIWRTETFSGTEFYIEKLKISDESIRRSKAGTPPPGEAEKYKIIITLTVKPG